MSVVPTRRSMRRGSLTESVRPTRSIIITRRYRRPRSRSSRRPQRSQKSQPIHQKPTPHHIHPRPSKSFNVDIAIDISISPMDAIATRRFTSSSTVVTAIKTSGLRNCSRSTRESTLNKPNWCVPIRRAMKSSSIGALCGSTGSMPTTRKSSYARWRSAAGFFHQHELWRTTRNTSTSISTSMRT